MNDKLTETFLDEARELLDGLEDHLLDLEQNPSDVEAMNAAFRALHSIKGSASMFGFDAVGAFAHEVEAALDYFRSMSLPASLELSDAVLRSRDYLRLLLNNPEAASAEEREELVATLAALSGATKKNAADKSAEDSKPKDIREFKTGIFKTFRIRYKPSPDTYRRGVKPEALVRELGSLGATSIYCDVSSVPSLSDIDPETCYLSWKIILTTSVSQDTVRDVFIFEEGSSDISVEEIDQNDILDGGEVRKLGEILSSGHIAKELIDSALAQQKPIGKILVEELGARKSIIDEALLEQQHAKNIVSAAKEEAERKTIRIRSDKLDGLLNLVGELVTVQAQLAQAVKDSGDRQLTGISDYVKRLAGELRTTSMELRLVPVESLFTKFKRLVRDLSKNLNKDIDLRLEGGETEIDKSVIDLLNDPLVHLIRNAADHGLESAAERKIAGKQELGTITLRAQHAGAFVRIIVSDDGKGLKREKIFSKAVERGLVAKEARLSDDEIDQLIFRPGFSTADVVSSVSGRGVGLDVVKTAIDQLGGNLSVTSRAGRGSDFVMDIPLTLAIIDGFLMRAGGGMFVIPLSSVDSCFEREVPKTPERLIVRGSEFIPYVSARELFGSHDNDIPSREEVVIVSVFESKLAIGFDHVFGGYQTVIKPIGETARYTNGVSGAAILADGGIALILDIAALAKAHKGTV